VTLISGATDSNVTNDIVTKISVANNRQNPIKFSDLFTNRKIHQTLKYKFKRYGIFYGVKAKEYSSTVAKAHRRVKEKFWFERSPINVIQNMKGNRLGVRKVNLTTSRRGPNDTDMLKFTQYILAFCGRPIPARLNVQAQYEGPETHNRLWCHYENAPDGADEPIGEKEFNEKLICFCTGAFLQNTNLQFDDGLTGRIGEVFGLGSRESTKQAKILMYNARWFFIHAFRKKYEVELEDLITMSTPQDICDRIDTYFDQAEKESFLNDLPVKLVEAIESMKSRVDDEESGYEDVGIDRPGRFLQQQKCLKEFENIVGV
jgi:hypothetical protein